MIYRACVVVLAVCAVGAVEAQPRIGVDLGTAIPTGDLGTHRSAGLAATLSATLRPAGLTPRFEVALARLSGDEPVSENGSNSTRGDYRAVGLRVSAMYRGRGSGLVAYGLAGVGLYGLRIERDVNPYGDVFGGIHLGVGLEVPLGAAALSAEAGAVAMATDYGAGAFNFPTVHVPLTVGVRF